MPHPLGPPVHVRGEGEVRDEIRCIFADNLLTLPPRHERGEGD